MKNIILRCISFYQRGLSPLKRPSCVFYPTCSEYAKEAVSKYGPFRGLALTLRRVVRCHPWQKNHLDPLK